MAFRSEDGAVVSTSTQYESALRRAVLLNDTVHDRHHGCTLVGRTIDRLAAANGIEIIGRSPVHHDWRSNQPLLKVMKSADLILINAEGTIHHDRPAGQTLLEAGPWCRERGIPAALINMTWEANNQQSAELLKQFSFLSVRESASRDALLGLGLSPGEAPDLALYSAHAVQQPRSIIGVTDSVLPGVSEQLEALRRRIGGSHISILYGHKGPREWLRSASKYGASATASPAKNLNAIVAAVRERRSQRDSADAFVEFVSRCRLLITGRFHAVIVALATRTPVLAVASNTYKIQATLRDAGLEPFRVTTPNAISAGLIERAAKLSDSENSNLTNYIEAGRLKTETMFNTIRGLG